MIPFTSLHSVWLLRNNNDTQQYLLSCILYYHSVMHFHVIPTRRATASAAVYKCE